MSNGVKTKTSTYITWIVVLAVLIGSVALISQGKKNEQKQLAEKYQDVKDEPITAVIGNSNDAKPEEPYTNSGPDAEDDSFFIKGRVESLVSLTDKEKNATVVWVSASWCEICHAMRPYVWKSANKYADKVAIKEIDLKSNPHIARTNQILGTPAFFVLDKNSNIISRFSGATQSMFEQQLEKASKL